MNKKFEIEFTLSEVKFHQQFDNLIKNQPIIDILIVINIISASKGLQLVSQKWFQSKIVNHESINAVILKINGNFLGNLPENLDLEFKDSFLIAFQSTVDKHESKIFWKNVERDKFYTIDIDDDSADDVTSYCYEYLVDEIKSHRTGTLENFQQKNKIRLQEIGNNDGHNLLVIATLKVQPKIVKSLLKYDFDPDAVIDLAWKKFEETLDEDENKENLSEIILNLLTENSRFPDDFEYEKASQELKEFVDKCESLHADVDSDDFNALKLKIESNPNLIHFYNRHSESLLAYSLRTRKFKIFELLDKSITTGSHEDLDEIYEKMYLKECRMLREQHKENAKEFSETHIFVLKSKSKIGNNDRNFHKNWKFIDEAFEKINKNEFGRKILKVAAEFKKLKIYFDFRHDSTYYLDPATSIYSKGIIYEGGSIFIGAKFLPHDEKKFEVFGVLAHELCHLAVYLAFMNRNFDPFPVGENEAKTRFVDKVMTQCKELESSENIVGNVFKSYSKDVQDSEMIVTVPQMLMHYNKDQGKIQELQEIFDELFRYWKEVVEPELDKALPVLKILGDDEKVVKFEDLTEPMKAKILHSTINFQDSETNFADLTGNDQDVLSLLTPGNIRKVLMKNGELEFSSICELNLRYGMIERNFIEAEIDEKMKLMELNSYVKEVKNFTKNLETIENLKVFLLADYAGTGKTTAFKDSAMKLKLNFKNFWVSYINLRLYGSIFEMYKHKVEDLKFEDVCQILLKIVDQESKIEEKIFTKLFFAGKTILLFDGFDEISPKYTQILLKIFQILTENETKNQIWIATRPHYTSKLTQLLKVPVHKFVGTTHFERVDMINRILAAHNVTAERGHLRILQNINMYIYGFFTMDKNSYNTLIDNPLMIQMITELFIDNSIQINDINICRLYLKMIEKQKEKVGTKIPNLERDPTGRLSVWDVHRILSILLIFGDDFDDELGFKIEELSIMKKWKKERKNWTSDMIQRYGLVIVDLNDENLRNSINFVHRTYAEFFVAQFLMDFVFDDSDELSEIEVKRRFGILDLIMKFEGKFDVVLDFMLKYFDVYPENKEFDGSVEKLFKLKIEEIDEEFDKIDADDFESLFTKFSNYAKFISKNDDLSAKLWKLEESKNTLQHLISKRYKNYIKLSKTAELCFGLNWNEKFNKNNKKLITDEELNALKGMSYNDFLLNSDKNLLKLYDLVQKTFKDDEKDVFVNNFEMSELNSIGAQLEVIFNINGSENGIQNYLNELNYTKISLENFELILFKIEEFCNNDQNLVKKFLSSKQYLALFKAADSENQEVREALDSFVTKYEAKIEENCDQNWKRNKLSEKLEL